MWVAIVGSRSLADDNCPDIAAGKPHPESCTMLSGWLEVMRAMTKAAKQAGFEGFVSGGAAGVDSWAEEIAEQLGEKCRVYRPASEKGKTFGERAHKRNERIVKQAGMVLAFFDPRHSKSSGTSDTVAIAGREAVEVHTWFGRWER